MTGVIKLGAVGALRDYSLKAQGEGIAWRRGPAQPFSAKVNTSGQYDEVDIWNEWIQEDWQAGVGRIDPTEGGFLYSELETRVPKQLILPPLVQLADLRPVVNTSSDCRYMPGQVAGSITVGSGGYTRAAMALTATSTVGSYLMFYARIPDGVSVTISFYSNSGGSPSTALSSGTVTGSNPDKLFQWHGIVVGATLSSATVYWAVIAPTSSSDTIEVAYGSSGYDIAAKVFNGTTWTPLASTYLLYLTSVFRTPNIDGANGYMIRFNGSLYHVADEGLYKYVSVGNYFSTIGTITGSGNVTSVAVFGPTLYFGRETSNYTTMNTSEVFTAAATTAKLFLEYDGTLYRSYQNDLYYLDDDLVTWIGPFTVGGDDVEIRGMAGMGDSLYCATDKAVYRFAPGNIVEETTRFGSEDTNNGVGMIEYQGKLYIPSAGRLFRFDPSGQMIDIWVARDDDLPATQLGRVVAACRMNNWLVAYVLPTAATARPTLWVFQDEGWHFLASAPSGVPTAATEIYSAYYDRGSSRLWFSLSGVWPMYVAIDDYTLNPFNSSTYLYQPYGWIEQYRFYGGMHLLNKDWESVTIVGDNLSTSVCVEIYFQDEDSTGWEYLGCAAADGEELRWGDPATRPQGKWIRLGLRLRTNDSDETPRIRAIIVKNLPMVNDRFNDTATLHLKNAVQMPNGTPDSYTLAQQLAHIQSMVASVIPIIYQDPFGVQYETKIIDWSLGATIFAHEGGVNLVKELEYNLVIQQAPGVAYTGQPLGLLLALTRS